MGQTADVSLDDDAAWATARTAENRVGRVCSTVTPLECSLREQVFVIWATFRVAECVVKHMGPVVTGPMPTGGARRRRRGGRETWVT
jgi:hypothetical protein